LAVDNNETLSRKIINSEKDSYFIVSYHTVRVLLVFVRLKGVQTTVLAPTNDF